MKKRISNTDNPPKAHRLSGVCKGSILQQTVHKIGVCSGAAPLFAGHPDTKITIIRREGNSARVSSYSPARAYSTSQAGWL